MVSPVLVIGAADSGSASLMSLIGEYGPEMPVKLYDKLPVGAAWTFKAVWVVTDTYYSRDQMDATIEKLRALKAHPEDYGVTAETVWVTVATDAAAAAAVAAAKEAAIAAARIATREKLAEKACNKLAAELDWVPDANKYRQSVSTIDGFNIAELIDIALPDPVMFMTNLFTEEDSTSGLSVSERLAEAEAAIARYKESGSEVRIKKYPGETTIQFSSMKPMK
jgi:hypothetical protein